MDFRKIREEFLNFFEKKGHKIVSSSSLLPTDPSVLFTTAGMQQFKEYFLGKESPYGDKVTSCQKCFRTSDIEEVGDSSHLTFLEMLGNFSFGSYFKEEAIKMALEFLTKKCRLELNDITFTYFQGDGQVPEDLESKSIWLKLGIPENKISGRGREDNFWGPTGLEGPCGPTTEIYANGVEIWNLVFNEYYQDKNKNLTPLKQKGVDTGMGLERLAMAVQKKSHVFETDLFSPIISEIPGADEKAKRIIADHVKSAVFLIAEGILPSNVERGYVLRRILRRAIRYGKLLDLGQNFLMPLVKKVMEIYQGVYPELKSQEANIVDVIQKEEEKFARTLEQGLKQFNKGLDAFELYATYGFPIELTQELAKEKGIEINLEEFNEKIKEHQEISRAGADKKFVGGLADHSEKTIKYHTAAHLMLAAMREILGPEINQKGSNITAERLRFDFNFPQRLSEEQIKKVEDLVNQKIKEDLPVVCEEMSLKEAKEKGATGVFQEKYGEKVKVYTIGSFSKEICGGPHVHKTGELGCFKITKEESSGAGVRRLRATLE